ncbi:MULTISPECIES: glutamate ABC transporter substrate-binding protein [Streptomycetaceae]|uniref:Putative ABC transporter solute-binding protein n=1 Tax=Streptantibioticus cattleyicolor (strain ATCC 35852 / DSM 46488 / JCM 4925 / NBRC 14057 / NRRL 8057) TaxID=1003195 RepID=F8JR44_STREN|nr:MULTISPECIES: glutamate ABC transporter substrate-binding protein [Streptomycetaceae]AEW94141.1 putative ABC transporter solute-binding protein [Streptantibioticus cattleyicolor NRRL 8057 = DSM 46488]MYS58806.1 transporter substrate-binding domain-containing protein [Streptomyces sp. SID5468]CCB74494.1 putative ABC transporter solute-binding protein [Streptantibioticus cattleyicolor NRRL 8057 = DSM 46488]
MDGPDATTTTGRPVAPGRRTGRLRGWGGVGSMAAACALALAVTVSVLLCPGRDAGHRAGTSGTGVAHARQAVATRSCRGPEASLRPSAAAGPAVRRIQARGYLVVGVDQSSYLWGYRDPATGRITGFDIDLVRAIARDLLGPDPRIVYKTVPTDERIPAIRSRQVDMVVRTMTVNCDRIRQVAFSTAYFVAGQQLLVPRAGSEVTGFDTSLKGKNVCTASGSTGQALLDEGAHGARVVLVPNQLDCLVRLQLGQVDAVLTDNALAAGQAAQDPAVHLIGAPLTREPYAVAMNPADTDLVRRVDKVLDDYRGGGASGPWMRAYTKWLARDLPGVTGPPAPRYRD